MMTGALDRSGTDAFGRGLEHALGLLVAVDAGAALVALALARFWRGLVVVAFVLVALPFLLAGGFAVFNALDEVRYHREAEQQQNGEYDFGDQPALLAVARAISENDSAAIRAAAKGVPNLQAIGRNGKTLLFFAVDESLTRPQLVDAVQTLLACGADPNFTAESAESFALAHAVDGPVRLLRVMLDAGGNGNARDVHGRPIILDNWESLAFDDDAQTRFHLLLDRGADVNSAYPPEYPDLAGRTLLMLCATRGPGDPRAYNHAIYLLERGADPNRAAADGTTLAKLLADQPRSFAESQEPIPPEFEALREALRARGVQLNEL